MADDFSQTNPDFADALQKELERAQERALAKVNQEMAEIARLAVAYPDAFKAIARRMGFVEAKEPSAASSTGIRTLGDLIDRYMTSPASSFQSLKHTSRAHYETLLGLIKNDFASQVLADATAETLDAWYAQWREGGKVAAAHGKMVMLRNAFGFGTMSVRDENCARLFGLLGKMQIELPKPRLERMTREQANLIRSKAHELGRPSIAIAQAFQSDIGLTQKDVIGEWAPMSEPGISDVMNDGLKWVLGLRWDEIDANLILKHLSGDKEIVIDLRKHPMVMEELERARIRNGGSLPSRGPVVVSEWNDLPWTGVEFRRWWRRLADACGLPKSLRNTDSRERHATASNDADESEGEPAFESKR